MEAGDREVSAPADDRGLRVLRCSTCGDTFAAEGEAPAICRTCGGGDLEVATEPFL